MIGLLGVDVIIVVDQVKGNENEHALEGIVKVQTLTTFTLATVLINLNAKVIFPWHLLGILFIYI